MIRMEKRNTMCCLGIALLLAEVCTLRGAIQYYCNRLYTNISDAAVLQRLVWFSSDEDIQRCLQRQKTRVSTLQMYITLRGVLTRRLGYVEVLSEDIVLFRSKSVNRRV